MIFTISGFYGSGGHDIAYEFARLYGFSVYGKELIAEAVKDSGVDLKGTTAEYYDETTVVDPSFSRAILSLEMDVMPIGSLETIKKVESTGSGILANYLDSLPLGIEETTKGVTKEDDIGKLVDAQTAVVKNAAKGDCIFVGRGASHILAGRDDVIRIFMTASKESCAERIAAAFGKANDKKLDNFIYRTNRRRALYFDTFTGKRWDDVANYDYCINTDTLGFDKTIELMKTIYELAR